MLVARFVPDVKVDQLAPGFAERFEIRSERNTRQIPLKIVLVTLPPIRGVHHTVEILPNVVLRDRQIRVVRLELIQAPIGDVISVGHSREDAFQGFGLGHDTLQPTDTLERSYYTVVITRLPGQR